MRAMVLVRHGDPERAFEQRELPDPEPGDGEVRITVDGFGLNFADCMARIGVYRDAPPLPSVLGYEVIGTVESVGSGTSRLKPGDRVLAFTRFGGYADTVVVPEQAAVFVPEGLDAAEALGLPTQGCTAWVCAEEMVRLHEGDRVLVHAAAGGVGSLLVQLAARRGCEVFATASTEEKLSLARSLGASHTINYVESAFDESIRSIVGEDGIDVAFDSVGGTNAARSFSLLGHGGRLVCYGAAEQAGARKSALRTLKMAMGFPFTHPVRLLLASQGVIGVNLLRIADSRPRVLERALDEVVALASAGELRVHVGGRFPVERLADAHALLSGRGSMGKISVFW